MERLISTIGLRLNRLKLHYVTSITAVFSIPRVFTDFHDDEFSIQRSFSGNLVSILRYYWNCRLEKKRVFYFFFYYTYMYVLFRQILLLRMSVPFGTVSPIFSNFLHQFPRGNFQKLTEWLSNVKEKNTR